MTTLKTLATTVSELKEKGLTDIEIGNELHLSTDTVVWLLTHESGGDATPPSDIRVGWRTIGIFPTRIRLTANIMTDVILEEMEKKARNVDAVCAMAVNGISFASFIGENLGIELLVYKPHPEGNIGSFSSNYASLMGKHVVIVDDVIGTGQSMTMAIKALKEAGAVPELAVVLVNKTPKDEIDGIPLRGLIRTISMQEMN